MLQARRARSAEASWWARAQQLEVDYRSLHAHSVELAMIADQRGEEIRRLRALLDHR